MNVAVVKIYYFAEMSNSESENTENDEKSSKARRFRPKKMDAIKEMPVDNLFEYIENLHSLVKHQEKKLKKHKDKIIKLVCTTFLLNLLSIETFRQTPVRVICDLKFMSINPRDLFV